jgi:hypothetical protein
MADAAKSAFGDCILRMSPSGDVSTGVVAQPVQNATPATNSERKDARVRLAVPLKMTLDKWMDCIWVFDEQVDFAL